MQSLSDRQRSVTADGDDRIDAERTCVFEQFRRPIDFDVRPVLLPNRIVKRVAPVRRAKDRPAKVSDASNTFSSELDALIFAEQPTESLSDSSDFPTAIDRGEHGGADDGVEPGRVTAAGRDSDTQR